MSFLSTVSSISSLSSLTSSPFIPFLVGGIVIFLLVLLFLYTDSSSPDPFSSSVLYRNKKEYTEQVKRLTDKYEPRSTGRRPVSELYEKEKTVPESEKILVNYYALGCRYPANIGPMTEGFDDPDVGIQTAVTAGCRVFVLDIDYIESCGTSEYIPRLVVRDIQGKLLVQEDSFQPVCQPDAKQIRTVCQRINDLAFLSTAPQSTDPVIIVLYFQRQPPGSYRSKAVLDYYSRVARALSPFKDRLLLHELEGGKFYRHEQEGKLLMKKITDYQGKVLIFNNANTAGFTEVKTYSAMEDLDFLTNLRLFTTQTKLGVTEQATGSLFGILQSVEDYTIIPPDRKEQVRSDTTLRWTLCLSQDPAVPVSKEIYEEITKTYGVHCIPTILSDEKNEYLFTDNTFKTYSYRLKPEALRYRKPPVAVPGEPNPSMNARQGKLLTPTL